jgi:hypothetical protein
MQIIDATILKAFLSALAQFKGTLPTNLSQEINQVGVALSSGETNRLKELENIARKHEKLNSLYEIECGKIQRQPQHQERNKLFEPSEKDAPAGPPPTPLGNIVAPNKTEVINPPASQQNNIFSILWSKVFPPAKPAESLVSVAVTILQANQPNVAANDKLAESGGTQDYFIGLPF